MIIVTGGRRTGKSSAVVRWFLEQPGQRCIFTSGRDRREHLWRMMYDMANYQPPKEFKDQIFILGNDGGVEQWGRGYRLPFPEIGIDDLEEVVANLFGGRLEFAAANATWIPLAQDPQAPIKAHVVQEEDSPRLIPEATWHTRRMIGGRNTPPPGPFDEEGNPR